MRCSSLTFDAIIIITWRELITYNVETKPELASRIFKCEFVRREFGPARIKIEKLHSPFSGLDSQWNRMEKRRVIPPLQCTNITFALRQCTFALIFFFCVFSLLVHNPPITWHSFHLPESEPAANDEANTKKYGDFEMKKNTRKQCTAHSIWWLYYLIERRVRVSMQTTTRCFYHYLSLWHSRSLRIRSFMAMAMAAQSNETMERERRKNGEERKSRLPAKRTIDKFRQ